LNLDRLPPSAKLVIKVLESGSLLTQKEIINRTYLPARTVRYALTRLLEENILSKRFYFPDARQSLYGLNAASSEVVTA
jgi:transcription initiation factor IIE alpha subunit